jgi:hypothetical protein
VQPNSSFSTPTPPSHAQIIHLAPLRAPHSNRTRRQMQTLRTCHWTIGCTSTVYFQQTLRERDESRRPPPPSSVNRDNKSLIPSLHLTSIRTSELRYIITFRPSSEATAPQQQSVTGFPGSGTAQLAAAKSSPFLFIVFFCSESRRID